MIKHELICVLRSLSVCRQTNFSWYDLKTKPNLDATIAHKIHQLFHPSPQRLGPKCNVCRGGIIQPADVCR